MLVLTRKEGEEFVFTVDACQITVTVFGIGSGKVKVGIDTPPSVKVWRKELIRKMWGLPPQEDSDDERERECG